MKFYRLLQTFIDSPFMDGSVKFEEGPLHTISEHPIRDLLDEIVEE